MLYRCLVVFVLAVCFSCFCVSCQGVADASQYTLVVIDGHGQPVEDAWVTPVAFGKNYTVKHTKLDGTVVLSDSYPSKPYTITVQKLGYVGTTIDWPFPRTGPATAIIKKIR